MEHMDWKGTQTMKSGFDSDSPAYSGEMATYSGTVHSQVWTRLRTTSLDPVKIRAWFADTTLENGGLLNIIGFPKDFHRQWVLGHYQDQLNAAFGEAKWYLKVEGKDDKPTTAVLTPEEETEILQVGLMKIGQYLTQKERDLDKEIPMLTPRQLLTTVRRMKTEGYTGREDTTQAVKPRPLQTMPTVEEMASILGNTTK